jgi:hypothetical protein
MGPSPIPVGLWPTFQQRPEPRKVTRMRYSGGGAWFNPLRALPKVEITALLLFFSRILGPEGGLV